MIVPIIDVPMLTGDGKLLGDDQPQSSANMKTFLYTDMALAPKIPIITIVHGLVVIPEVLLIWAMNTNMEPAVTRLQVLMKYLPKIKAIDHGGVRISSYPNRFCSALGMAFSLRA